MNHQEELNRQLAGEGIEIRGAVRPEWTTILTPDAVRFVATLTRRFNPTRKELLAMREARQARLDAGENPDFLPETKAIRDGDWQVAPPPPTCKTGAWKSQVP
jgi:malate synthase